ncbi:MAG: hypothetical protein ACI4EX_11800 [Lachnospiraceae bacterium]
MMNYNIKFDSSYEFMGDLCVINTKETVNDVSIRLDSLSQRKLLTMIQTGTFTRETQDLFAETISFPKEDEEILLKGQSGWIKTENGFVLSANPSNPAHFSAKINCLGTPSSDPGVIYAYEISMGNFTLDFSHASKEIVDDYIFYSNVELTVFSNKNTIKELHDSE